MEHTCVKQEKKKVAAALDIDTSILSKTKKNERRATIEMLPVFCEIFDKSNKEVQLEFIKSLIISDLGELEYLEVGLKKILKTLAK